LVALAYALWWISDRLLYWLKQDYGLGRGHAMALVHVIKNGAQISDKHVESGGTHSDPSATLRLTGKDS